VKAVDSFTDDLDKGERPALAIKFAVENRCQQLETEPAGGDGQERQSQCRGIRP
jgi:hypothetical protein